MRLRQLTLLVAAAGVALLAARGGDASAPAVELVSRATNGQQGALGSFQASISADGRYVAFSSDAPNLVFGDTNSRDVFVRDRVFGTTALVSRSTGGAQANAPALSPAISADGRYVAFASEAGNLVPNDGNNASDVFLHDQQLGTTERVSLSSIGAEGSGDSVSPSVSGDGRYVTFTSTAPDLVEGDGNMDRDVFLRDRRLGTTELVSVSTAGVQGNFASGGAGAGPARITSDGRFIVFGSFANNLVADDGNSRDDVFVRDRQLGATERVSVASDGGEGDGHSVYGSISDDGRYVAFWSTASDLVDDDGNGATADVFLHDRDLGTTALISRGPADGPSRFPAVSGDGAFIAYESDATDIVPGDPNGPTVDILRYDITSGETERLAAGNGASIRPAVAAAGVAVAFESVASDLVAPDANGAAGDIFVWGKPLAAPSPTATPTRTATPSPTATATPAVQRGDVDCSGAVTSIDAALILQRIAGLLPSLPCNAAADVNQDGVVNAVDAAIVLQHVAGLYQIPG